MHSLKGLAGMLGFGDISELSHSLEDMLDKLRMGKIEISKELIDLLYDSDRQPEPPGHLHQRPVARRAWWT